MTWGAQALPHFKDLSITPHPAPAAPLEDHDSCFLFHPQQLPGDDTQAQRVPILPKVTEL